MHTKCVKWKIPLSPFSTGKKVNQLKNIHKHISPSTHTLYKVFTLDLSRQLIPLVPAIDQFISKCQVAYRHIYCRGLWCMCAIACTWLCVYVCYTFSLWIWSINWKADIYTHTPTKPCVLLRTHIGTHINKHQQFQDDGCLACWPCYPLTSPHILSKTFAVLVLYYMSDRKRKRWEQ